MSVQDRAALARAVAGSLSIREALEKLELVAAGGNYESFKKAVLAFGIDTSHFTGRGHLRGKTHAYNTRPLRTVLRRGKLEQTFRLKLRLLSAGLKPHRCERCGLTEWLGRPVPLELHHRDGDRTNNLLSNLELMCPNCHAQTDNYRGKNKKRVETRRQRPTVGTYGQGIVQATNPRGAAKAVVARKSPAP